MSTRSRTLAVLLAVTAGASLTVAGCDAPFAPTCRDGSAFALSLVSDTGGQPSPVAAATWFAAHGGVGPLPSHGWHVVAQDADGARLEAGSSSLHAVQGGDGTWQVDGGTRCR